MDLDEVIRRLDALNGRLETLAERLETLVGDDDETGGDSEAPPARGAGDAPSVESLWERVDTLRDGLGLAPINRRTGQPADPEGRWNSFLATHPELKQIDRAGPTYDFASLPLPADDALVDALADLGAGERPVSVTEIAQALWQGEHGHGDLCRLGRRLGTMAGMGLVVRGERRGTYGPHKWLLPAAGRGDGSAVGR